MTLGGAVFLVDSDNFIEAYKKYYSFEFTPGFWRFMRAKIDDGTVIILDKVYDELVVEGNDSLSNWLLGIRHCPQIKHKESAIVEMYSSVINYIRQSDFYNSVALDSWSKDNIADPWIVACAKVKNYTVVTFESANGKNLSAKTPTKNPKIPDICSNFGVKCINLFDMLKELNFTL